ncbi:hypothetical protein DFJ74DRAFT_677112 [Hyaloraphidium curvatum]|nr:hypothetical protein DFJ74DRAFT_677112 [Hyaloraphidium curvatum]
MPIAFAPLQYPGRPTPALHGAQHRGTTTISEAVFCFCPIFAGNRRAKGQRVDLSMERTTSAFPCPYQSLCSAPAAPLRSHSALQPGRHDPTGRLPVARPSRGAPARRARGRGLRRNSPGPAVPTRSRYGHGPLRRGGSHQPSRTCVGPGRRYRTPEPMDRDDKLWKEIVEEPALEAAKAIARANGLPEKAIIESATLQKLKNRIAKSTKPDMLHEVLKGYENVKKRQTLERTKAQKASFVQLFSKGPRTMQIDQTQEVVQKSQEKPTAVDMPTFAQPTSAQSASLPPVALTSAPAPCSPRLHSSKETPESEESCNVSVKENMESARSNDVDLLAKLMHKLSSFTLDQAKSTSDGAEQMRCCVNSMVAARAREVLSAMTSVHVADLAGRVGTGNLDPPIHTPLLVEAASTGVLVWSQQRFVAEVLPSKRSGHEEAPPDAKRTKG